MFFHLLIDQWLNILQKTDGVALYISYIHVTEEHNDGKTTLLFCLIFYLYSHVDRLSHGRKKGYFQVSLGSISKFKGIESQIYLYFYSNVKIG